MPRVRALVAVVLVALALSGCASLTERAGLPPSVDRAAQLESGGDSGGAARVYEQLAGQNTGADRNEFLLHAARDYLAANRPEDAARVLTLTAGALSVPQASERALLNVQLALERNRRAEAAREFAAIGEPAGGPLRDYYHELKARLAQQTPANQAAPPGGHAAPPGEPAAHVALLLPVSGRAAAAAASVRDGFMTAYYQAPANERPHVRIYDTGTLSIAEALKQAHEQGAEFIVGPLTREDVTAAAEYAGARAPMLALNYLPTDHPVPADLYQFALSPEDEARLAAHRVLDDHHKRGVAIVPAGDWGARVLAAFKQELTAGGGELLASAQIDAARTDFSPAVIEVLRINESAARWKRLESVLGTKLQFEPRRRADIEFIFSPAQAATERLLRPQLRFHYAGDIPTYATSDAFDPDLRANDDLEGLMFPDMPWILGGDFADAVRAAAREAWPNGSPYRGRLFAFGFDAFRLAQALPRHGAAGSVGLEGLTGRLSLDSDRHIRRELNWAQVHNGELRLLAAPAP